MELPERIRRSLEKIREGREHYVDIKVINGRCYVYESTSRWDRARKKVVKAATYIGKILDDGTFVEAVHRRRGAEAALVGPQRLRSRQAAARRPAEERVFRERLGKYDEKILEALSMDGRITTSELSSKVGIKSMSAESQKAKLEKRYGIEYIAETDVSRLGYLTYIVMIKFENKKPGINEARRELEKEASIQLAMLTYGMYDVVLYMVVSRYENIKNYLFNLRSRIFPSYDLKLYVVPFYLDYSFVPLRDRFFDMLNERVWVRSAERPKPREGELHRREYATLKELSRNGRMDFTNIDVMYGLPLGSSRYAYQKLQEKGVVRRVTISMRNIHINYISAISLNKINHSEFVGSRKELMQHIIKDPEGSAINKYALIGDIKMPEGVLFLMPVRNDTEIMEADEELRRVGGAEVDSMIVTNIIVGSLCYRKFDNSSSSQYRILQDEFGVREPALS